MGKRFLILSMLVSAAFLMLGSPWAAQGTGSKTVRSLSMADAYALAKPEALSWDSRAKLYWMNSVDVAHDVSSEQGRDGTRRKWNVEFVVPSTEQHFTVVIYDGQIAKVTAFTNATLWEPFDELPAIPMVDVLETVKAIGLEPSTNVAFGYHYKLHQRRGIPTLEVVGAEKGSARRRVIAFRLVDGEAKVILETGMEEQLRAGLFAPSGAPPIPHSANGLPDR